MLVLLAIFMITFHSLLSTAAISVKKGINPNLRNLSFVGIQYQGGSCSNPPINPTLDFQKVFPPDRCTPCKECSLYNGTIPFISIQCSKDGFVQLFTDDSCTQKVPLLKTSTLCFDYSQGFGFLCCNNLGRCPPTFKDCSPSLKANSKACQKKVNFCFRKNVVMKFAPQRTVCGGSATDSCVCDQYCGYSCPLACNRDKQCSWQNGTCVNVAGVSVSDSQPCPYRI